MEEIVAVEGEYLTAVAFDISSVEYKSIQLLDHQQPHHMITAERVTMSKRECNRDKRESVTEIRERERGRERERERENHTTDLHFGSSSSKKI